LFAWDAWVFVFWQGLGERWRRIDEDMRRLIDEGWREVIWMENVRKKKLKEEASNGGEGRSLVNILGSRIASFLFRCD
jgi:hypothetical protein